MMRTMYNKKTMSFVTMSIGNLQTLATIPVIAGDSMSVRMRTVARLSPLLRYAVLEPEFNLYAFFVPHRHVYDNWKEYIMAGADDSETLASVIPGDEISSIGMIAPAAKAIPLHMSAGYAQIWNRYFRRPSADISQGGRGQLNGLNDDWISETGLPTSWLKYGMPCTLPKTFWNTGVKNEIEEDDYTVPEESAGGIDVRKLEQKRARYGTQIARQFFAQESAARYKDFLALAFGKGSGKINVDADERPTLLMMSDGHVRSHDVDGTGDENLGTFMGKGAAQFEFGFPRRFFPEHGYIWILALARFPLCVVGESHYLNRKVNPSYMEFTADPKLAAAEPPVSAHEYFDEIFISPNNAFTGTIPSLNYHRELPVAYVHPDFADAGVNGFPFLEDSQILASDAALHYYRDTQYNDMFQTEQLGQMQAHSNIRVDVKSIVPPAKSSIFSGAR